MSSSNTLPDSSALTPFGARLAWRPDLPWPYVLTKGLTASACWPAPIALAVALTLPPIAAGIARGMGGRVSWSNVACGQPQAGAVFRYDAGVRGAPQHAFAG